MWNVHLVSEHQIKIQILSFSGEVTKPFSNFLFYTDQGNQETNKVKSEKSDSVQGLIIIFF